MYGVPPTQHDADLMGGQDPEEQEGIEPPWPFGLDAFQERCTSQLMSAP